MSRIGRFDWGSWFYGLAASFIVGGAGAVSTGFSTMFVDPAHFNLAQPRMLIEAIMATFLFAGFPAFFAYLHQNPLPTEIRTTTTTTSVQDDPPAIVKTTVETKETL